MRFVIDSNEYIFAFGPSKDPVSLNFLMKLLEAGHSHTIRMPRTIFEEVKRNLPHEAFREFVSFINSLTTVDEDFVVPFEIAFKYEVIGFKTADAFIAAYAEWTGADALVKENRHFLSQHSNLPFKILNAADCLNLIQASLQ